MRLRNLLTCLVLALGLAFVQRAQAEQKPLTRDQVLNLVRNQLGDETGAKAIEQRGIDFEPAADFIQSLKDAGANEAFIQALRKAKRAKPPSEAAKKPLTQVQVMALLAGEVPSRRVAMLVEDRGIDFEPKKDYLEEVRLGGGKEELIKALQTARASKPATVDPAAEAQQAEVRKHAAQGAEFFQRRRYADAEVEYRAAVHLDPENADLHVALSRSLTGQKKVDEAMQEAREALRLNPNYDLGHYSLGNALLAKGNLDGATAEYREALRLNPNNDLAHNNLGSALKRKGDLDGAIVEYREALRLNPNHEEAHNSLGVALEQKGDLDGAMAEYREALRLNPNYANAHNDLGWALRQKGDLDGAIAEYREALRLNPNFELAHDNLGVALGPKGDLEGAMAEYREALRLNPKNANAHNDLGSALRQKGDLDGAMAEYREALRLNPNHEMRTTTSAWCWGRRGTWTAPWPNSARRCA